MNITPQSYDFAVVTCPAITPVDGEIYIDPRCMTDKLVYNETCEVSCELGYNLTSSDGVHKCTEDDTWDNNVTCERTPHYIVININMFSSDILT